jgi:hypothetical protein
MEQNTVRMTSAQETIATNTVAVKEATSATIAFGGFMTIFMIIYFIVLLVPAFILYRLYLKLARAVERLTTKK